MPESITPQVAAHVAHLARLDLAADELDQPHRQAEELAEHGLEPFGISRMAGQPACKEELGQIGHRVAVLQARMAHAAE